MITNTVSVEDYIAGHRLHYRKVYRIMWGVSIALVLIGVIASFSELRWAHLAIFGGLGGMGGQWWEQTSRLPAKVKKLYTQYAGIADPITINWDAEYIEGSNANGHGKRRWQEYLRLKEDEKVFLLYVTDQLWHVYPKRWFEVTQLEEFGRNARLANNP